MDNKLEQLTRKLYDEGLEKGRSEAQQLVEAAREEASKIVGQARAEASKIEGDARTEAEDLRRNTMTELNLAGAQMVAKLKSAIREMVVARALGDSVGNSFLDPAFVREVLLEAVRNWREGASLTAVLPETMRGKLDEKFGDIVPGGELDLEFSDGVQSGFRLMPREGGYYIDFGDEAFDAMLREYLRPKVDEILYR